jgi:hypothetical protein
MKYSGLARLVELYQCAEVELALCHVRCVSEADGLFQTTGDILTPLAVSCSGKSAAVDCVNVY